jgi:hypothetical protein
MLLRPRNRLLSRRGRRLLYSGVDEKEHLWDEAVGRWTPKAALPLGKVLEGATIRHIEDRREPGAAILH